MDWRIQSDLADEVSLGERKGVSCLGMGKGQCRRPKAAVKKSEIAMWAETWNLAQRKPAILRARH